jgi:hypothetical protein
VLLHAAALSDSAALNSTIAGAVFIPSFALALGAISGSSKAFEALFTAVWYIGPLNHAAGFDFTLLAPHASAPLFLAISGVALACAVTGRFLHQRS